MLFNLISISNIPLFIPIMCYCLGLILVLIEMFSPGFGAFGILGGLCIIAGIVLRALAGATAIEIALTIVVAIALIILSIVLMSKSARSGKLSKTPLILTQNAVDNTITEGTKDYTYLLGATGKTITFLRPIGKAKFNDETVDVITENAEIIEANTLVKVVGVEGQRIIVEKE